MHQPPFLHPWPARPARPLPPDSRRRPRPRAGPRHLHPHPRRGEAGVSIVLVFLVLLVMVAVLTELRYSASVELDRAYLFVDVSRMRRLADAAAQQALAALVMDSEAAQEAETVAGGDAGGPDGDGNDEDQPEPPDPFGGDDAPGGEEEEESLDGAASEASIAETVAATDSHLDDWADAAALAPALGEDWSLLVEVEDEDSKINLLGLWTEDETLRADQHDIVRELLDKAFEGTSHDISYSDATDILDNLDDWVAGDRGSFDPVPTPPLKKTNAQEEAEGGSLDTAVIDTDETHYPLTLGELLMLPGLFPEHLSGFVEDDTFHPGLESYLTVFSQLELKDKPKGEESLFADSPLADAAAADGGGGGGGAQGGQALGGGGTGDGEGGAGESPGVDDEDFEPEPTNDGLVNVNTAPLAVLRAVAPQEFPTSFIERIVEYRNRIDELRKEQGLGGTGSLFDNAKGGTAEEKSGADEATDSGFAEGDEEDITQYVFQEPQEAIDKVEEEYGIELKLDPGVEEEFVARLAVSSQVFTVKVLVYRLGQNQTTGRMEFDRRSTWRTTVWRMLGDEVPHVLTLQPLEPFHDSRRLKDYPGDLEQLATDHAQGLSQAGIGS